MTNSFLSVDLETTGLNPKIDKIIEIGAIKIADGKIIDTYETFVNPKRRLSSQIIKLTGITEKDLENAREPEEVISEFIEFAGDSIFLGHSVLFDYSFLKRIAVNQNYAFEKDGIDTLKIARRFLSALPSRGLGSLCEHYGITHHSHRALADAAATSELYFKMAEEFYDEKEFAPYRLKYQVKKEGPITAHQKERLLSLIERHTIDIDYDVDKLTKNKASRITDQILATYGR